jgi:vacuolar-type H+-ATPase subunit H
MSKQFTETKQEKDEFSRIFTDYRTKLDEITRQMQKNLGFELPEPDPPTPKTEDIVIDVQTKAELEPQEMFLQVREELEIEEEPDTIPEILDTNIIPELVSEKPEPVMVRESEEIIREAKQNASRIITEAEKRIKDEAKKKTESQVNKIITQAQKEAQDIIDRARQYTEEQKNEAIGALKQLAQQSIDEIINKCRRETQEQSSLIIRESRDKAAKMINDILAAGKEMSQLMEEAVNSTGKTINDFEARIKTGNETLLKAISQSQHRFFQVTMASNEEKSEEKKSEAAPDSKRKEPKNAPALIVRLLSDNHDTQGDGLFCGKIEVKSVSTAFDYTYLKNLKKFLIHIPSIKYLQESASEKAVTMMFEISDPLPLLDILHNIPSIDEVTSEANDNIWLTFKDSDHL